MSYVIIGIIIGIIVAVVVVISKKDAKELEEMVAKLSEEQKKLLMETEVEFVEKNAWVQDAIIAKMVDKGGKYDVRLLWYNKVMNNNESDEITLADATLKKAEQEAHDLKVGDVVKLYIAPEKTVGSVKIVLD
ncbi:MAG: hypothetical protein J6N53_17695 [Lachnospiraceae bacterium]|nr:hypothetical protein [Lachnospiraceae bacterium]MBP3295696.1 hypothetical protein [Lachnospiraceae bacterium]